MGGKDVTALPKNRRCNGLIQKEVKRKRNPSPKDRSYKKRVNRELFTPMSKDQVLLEQLNLKDKNHRLYRYSRNGSQTGFYP